MRWTRVVLAVGLVALSGLTFVGPAEARRAQLDINRSPGEGPTTFASGSVATGDTVVWQNNDDNTHSVVGPGFSTGNISPDGGRAEHTFLSPGSFEFHCGIHPSMIGTLQVTGAPVTAAQPPPPPPPPPAPGSTSSTRRVTGASTTRATTSSTVPGPTTTTTGFGVLAPTSSTASTTSTTGDVAIKEDDDSGTDSTAVAAIGIAILAVLGGGGFMLYRLRAR